MKVACVLALGLAVACHAAPLTSAPAEQDFKPPQSKYMPKNPSWSYITTTADATSDKQLNLVQTKTRCWWGYSCSGDAANSDAVCTERCNCYFVGNTSLGYQGCIDRDADEAQAIYDSHCTDYGTMGPCQEDSGSETTYAQLTNGKYPTLAQVETYNYQSAQAEAAGANDYNSTVAATGANDDFPDEWELTCTYPANCPVFDFTKFDAAIESTQTGVSGGASVGAYERYGPYFTLVAGDMSGPGQGWAAGWDLKINDQIPNCNGFNTNGPYTMPDASTRKETKVGIVQDGGANKACSTTTDCGINEVCSDDLSPGTTNCITFESGQDVTCSADTDCFYGSCDSGLGKCVYDMCIMVDTSKGLADDTWGTAVDSKLTTSGFFVGGSDAENLPTNADVNSVQAYNAYTDFGGKLYDGAPELNSAVSVPLLGASQYRGYHTHGMCGQTFQSPINSIYMIATFGASEAPDTFTQFDGFAFDWSCKPCGSTITSTADVSDVKVCPGLAATPSGINVTKAK